MPVATWPPHRRAGRGLPSAERRSVGRGAAGAAVSCVTPLAGVPGTPTRRSHGADGRVSPWTQSRAVAGHAAAGVSRTPSALGSSGGPCLGRAGPCMGQPSERILPYGRATCCKDSCYRHVLPSMTGVVFPNSEQLWPSALWRKETVLRVQEAEHPPWKCPPLLSSLQQTCLHCSLTFFFLYFYFCMSFAFQIL